MFVFEQFFQALPEKFCQTELNRWPAAAVEYWQLKLWESLRYRPPGQLWRCCSGGAQCTAAGFLRESMGFSTDMKAVHHPIRSQDGLLFGTELNKKDGFLIPNTNF